MNTAKAFTYNLPARVGEKAARADMTGLMRICDVGVLQEGIRHGALFGELGWDSTWTDDAALAHLNVLPIGWDPRRFNHTGHMSLRAYPDTRVGQWGAGPATLRAGWEHGIRLEDRRGGDELWVFNVHLAPSVTQRPGNLTKEGREGLSRRRMLYKREVAEVVSGVPKPAIVLGDFNAERSFGLLEPMIRAGFTLHSAGATHNGHGIDLCAARGPVTVRGLGTTPGGSDHHAAIYGARLRA